MMTHPIVTLKDLPAPPLGKRGWPWTVGPRPLRSHQPDGSAWPRLSIITPSYNQGNYLEASIRSVLLQGYPNLEYIVIDGSSSDQSVEIIRKYEPWLSYWVSEIDRGQSDAINKGLLQSTGTYIGWVNSDDIYLEKAFQQIIQIFSANPEYVLVHGNRILIDPEGNVQGCAALPAFNPPIVSVPVFSETAFWSRAAMNSVGLLDPTFHFSMDLEFFTRLALHGTIYKTNKFLGCLRCHPESKSSTIPGQGRKETDQLWQKLFNCEYTAHNIPRNYMRKQALIAILTNPGLFGWPYLKHKMKRSLTHNIEHTTP
jgi:glycosyltransferase involved in cell wall biosynthesis